MLVLALDTATAAVTAGVAEVDGTGVRVRAEQVVVDARAHGEQLSPLIAAVLDRVGATPSDLGAVVAGVGPGPFTGLRVGLVTAAVMAELLDIPAYGVATLDALAADCPGEPVLLVATDARRREVYWARYADGVRTDGPEVSRPADVPVEGVTAAVGAGAEQYHVTLGVPLRPERFPSVAGLVAVAAERIRAGAAGDPLTPLYLRRPDAQPPGAVKRVTP